MGNKDKDDAILTKTTTPVEKEFNAETIKTRIHEKTEYHNKLAAERDKSIGETNKITEVMTLVRGEINGFQDVLKEYFVADKPSDNGSA